MPVAIPAAIVGAAAIGGAASIVASNKASKTAREVANKNNALQESVYNQNKAALQPYVDAGNKATPAIQALLGLSGTGQDAINNQNAAFQNFRNSTGYQDQFAEGQRAVTSALGNRGLLDSGAANKALVKYGQSQANQSFGDYYSRLSGQQALGLSGASALAGVGTNYANSVSNNNIYAGDAKANAALSTANSINGLLQSGLSAYAYTQGMGSSYGGQMGRSGTPPIYGGNLGGIY